MTLRLCLRCEYWRPCKGAALVCGRCRHQMRRARKSAAGVGAGE
jgi:uncharacterized paraquat-inducible protein A